MNNIAYEKANSLPEALALYGMHGGRFAPLAGGTDLIIALRTGALNPEGIVDISCVDELKLIEEKESTIEIGATATHASIIANETVNKYARVLADACATVGATQIQNRGTIGGNIMNASPAGDTPPVLQALGANLLFQTVASQRWIPVSDFYTGYRKTAALPGELLTKISIPKMQKNDIAKFYKIGTRMAQAISKIVMCVRGKISHGGIGDIFISVGSVAATVVRARGTEALLRGKVITSALIDLAKHSIEDEVHPIDDVRSTADYRRFVCGSLIVRFLKEAVSKPPIH